MKPRLAGQNAPWPRRILALAGVASVVSGLVLLPAGQESLAVTHGHAGGSGSRSGSRVTVRGPRMLNPNSINPGTGSASLFKYHSSVTVSQTANLVNQTIQVSWKGFTPTPPGSLPYSQGTTPYPVVIAECRGTHPAHLSDCFGVAGRDGTEGGQDQFGPYNDVWSTTTAKGTGVADIPVLSDLQNQFLGCSPARACSLAVIPVQGGNILQSPFSCTNHAEDGPAGGDTSTSQVTFGNPRPGAPPCSWDKRVVVPLHFAPSLANCKFKTPTFTVIGSPMAQREMDQWDTGLCEQASPLFISYSFSLPEPAAISAVQSGEGDIALTTRPAATLTGAHHKYAYAPISVSAVSIPYWVDNTNTGDPFTRLRLDPRLVAKMLTTSYNLAAAACTPHPTKICDPGVDGNPADIIVDHEFTRLNPGINIGDTSLGSASIANDVPIVQSGPSDMTYMLTRWMAANKEATQFLSGIPDRWGMRLNSYYSSIKYPTDAFVPADPSTVVAHAYSPIFPLALGVSDMVEAWPPGTGYLKQICGTTGGGLSYCRLAQETPGSRVLFGVLDYGDTDAFQVPSAAILNPAGRYVTPSQKSMLAAVNSMVDNGNKITQEVSTTSKNPNEYPLTMVIYAMVPVSNVPPAKADAIARWLRYLAGAGQHQGTAPGTLPVGYLPLTPRLRAQTLTAASEVQNQAGNSSKSAGPSPSTSASPSSSVSPSPGSSVSSSPSSGVAFPKIGQKISTVAVRDPQAAGFLRYALPGVLIIGGLAALGGASSLLAPSSGAIAARLRRLYHAGELRRSKP